jgi:uncharacterized protein YndB with AHSA1/START domain
MFQIVAIVVVVLLVALLGYASTKPDTFRIERKTTISAPPEKIFPLIDDFHGWAAWSPWEKLDPDMKRTFSGAERGKGAVYAWEGNGKAGAGTMEITDSSPPSKLTIKLDFIRPFEGHNVAEFTLEPSGGATRVTWAMHGPSSYLSKVMGVFISMDSLVGKDFEAGLAAMKAAAEKA